MEKTKLSAAAVEEARQIVRKEHPEFSEIEVELGAHVIVTATERLIDTLMWGDEGTEPPKGLVLGSRELLSWRG